MCQTNQDNGIILEQEFSKPVETVRALFKLELEILWFYISKFETDLKLELDGSHLNSSNIADLLQVFKYGFV